MLAFIYLCPMFDDELHPPEHNEDSTLHSFVYSEEVLGFVGAANDFCQFLEELKGLDGKKFIRRAVPYLSGVYRQILAVPDTEPVYESAGEPTVTEQDWSRIYQRIAALLGPYNEYLRPAEEEEFDRSDLVTHTISEDMADVYQELRE